MTPPLPTTKYFLSYFSAPCGQIIVKIKFSGSGGSPADLLGGLLGGGLLGGLIGGVGGVGVGVGVGVGGGGVGGGGSTSSDPDPGKNSWDYFL